MAELDSLSGGAVHDEGRVAGERPRVERAAAVEQPPVLLGSVGEHDHVRQRVERQGVVQLPVDGPRRQRQRAQVSLVQEGLGALVGSGAVRCGAVRCGIVVFCSNVWGCLIFHDTYKEVWWHVAREPSNYKHARFDAQHPKQRQQHNW